MDQKMTRALNAVPRDSDNYGPWRSKRHECTDLGRKLCNASIFRADCLCLWKGWKIFWTKSLSDHAQELNPLSQSRDWIASGRVSTHPFHCRPQIRRHGAFSAGRMIGIGKACDSATMTADRESALNVGLRSGVSHEMTRRRSRSRRPSPSHYGERRSA